MKLTPSTEKLLAELCKLPGIGRRSALRILFHLLRSPGSETQQLARTLLDFKEKIHFCAQCFNLTENTLCSLCTDQSRSSSLICIVQDPVDLLTIEASGAFKGLYHVLHGLISPLKGVLPEDLKIPQLHERLKKHHAQLTELILALPLTAEGETTALYLLEQCKPMKLKITRLGLGLPAGATLEFADQRTIKKALEGRTSL